MCPGRKLSFHILFDFAVLSSETLLLIIDIAFSFAFVVFALSIENVLRIAVVKTMHHKHFFWSILLHIFPHTSLLQRSDQLWRNANVAVWVWSAKYVLKSCLPLHPCWSQTAFPTIWSCVFILLCRAHISRTPFYGDLLWSDADLWILVLGMVVLS